MACRSGCPTQDHRSWCINAEPRARQRFFADAFAEGRWVCVDCDCTLPLSQFQCRKSGRHAGRPIAARCARHQNVAMNRRRKAWQYGVKDYDALLAEQGGRCAICGTSDPGDSAFRIDHDHACCPGKRSCGRCVRGLLCNRCNVGIAMFQDNPNAMRRAIAYVGR